MPDKDDTGDLWYADTVFIGLAAPLLLVGMVFVAPFFLLGLLFRWCGCRLAVETDKARAMEHPAHMDYGYSPPRPMRCVAAPPATQSAAKPGSTRAEPGPSPSTG